MKFRVGDKVLDDGTAAVVISSNGFGRYEVRHTYTGFESFAGRSNKQLKLVKRCDALELGDKVMAKKSRRVGEVTETTERGGKQTEIKVTYAGGYNFDIFNNPKKELILLRRSGEDKEEFSLRGKRVKITGQGRKKHNFRMGDVCTVDDSMTMGRDTHYLLIRENDGFEQVVSRQAFTEIEHLGTLTNAGEIIDMVYAEVEPIGTPITFEEGYKGEWFPILLRFEFHFYGRHYEKGSELKAREVFMGGTLQKQVYVTYERNTFMNNDDFNKFFIKKEDTEMAEEKKEVALVDEKAKEMERQIAELQAETERLHKENVAKEFGVVEKNHLWSVTILIPARTKFMPRGFGGSPTEQSTEVVTEGQSMVEAAMVAEGMAKGISEEAVVLSVSYQRVLGAIK